MFYATMVKKRQRGIKKLARVAHLLAITSPFNLLAQTPTNTSIVRIPPNLHQISWTTQRLSRYQLQASPDLVNWVNLGVGFNATNNGTAAAQAYDSGTEMFYRAKVGAVRHGLFAQNALEANDDESSVPTPLGFSINLFGVTRTNCYVNNNGNITFDAALRDFTPDPLRDLRRHIIAPFWADVDTRPADPTLLNPVECRTVTYGQGSVDGHLAFGVNWMDVGYYDNKYDKLNGFQLVIIQRSDTGAPTNFDIEFNYDYILWETGEITGDGDGYGGMAARVGVSNGSNRTLEFVNSGITKKFLDYDPITFVPNETSGLIYGSRLSNVAGRYIIQSRNGNIPGAVDIFAGADRDVYPTTTSQTLSGQVSSPTGDTFSVKWTIDSIAPAGASLAFSNPNILNPTVTFTAGIEVTLRLTATSNSDPTVIAADSMRIY